MNEEAEMVQNDIPREQALLEPADLNDSELENVSGGQEDWGGAQMEVEQEGGDNGTAPLHPTP